MPLLISSAPTSRAGPVQTLVKSAFLCRSGVEALLERCDSGLEARDVLFQIRQVALDDLPSLVLVRQARLDAAQCLRDREVFLIEPLEAPVDLVEVSEHLVAQLGDPGFHRVEPPTELAKLMPGLAKPPVDLTELPPDLVEATVDVSELPVELVEALVHLGEPAREEVDELLMLAGHGSSLPQADRSFKCVSTWTPEDVPRPAPLG